MRKGRALIPIPALCTESNHRSINVLPFHFLSYKKKLFCEGEYGQGRGKRGGGAWREAGEGREKEKIPSSLHTPMAGLDLMTLRS